MATNKATVTQNKLNMLNEERETTMTVMSHLPLYCMILVMMDELIENAYIISYLITTMTIVSLLLLKHLSNGGVLCHS